LFICALLGALRSAEFIGLGGVGFLTELVLTNALGAMAVAFGGAVFLFALISLILGWGVRSGEGWAWGLAVAYFVLWVLAALLLAVAGAVGQILGLLFAGGILFYMVQPDVQEYFGRQA
jgi:hypothetical protein